MLILEDLWLADRDLGHPHAKWSSPFGRGEWRVLSGIATSPVPSAAALRALAGRLVRDPGGAFPHGHNAEVRSGLDPRVADVLAREGVNAVPHGALVRGARVESGFSAPRGSRSHLFPAASVNQMLAT